MKIVKRFIIIFLILCISIITNVNAAEKISINEEDYSEDYKKWLSLSEKEKENVIEPLKYNTKSSIQNINEITNILKINKRIKAGLTSKYDLRDVIPENLVVRNQMNTQACWAFATLGSMESNLALKDLRNSQEKKIYDFSEMHMNYSLSRNSFLNNQINPIGVARKASDGASVVNALAYLTNGSGAIKEDDMKFEDTTDDIDISRIKNKEVITTLNDMSVKTDDSKNNMSELKEKIKEYGGVVALIHGNSIFSEDCYNNSTGAIYCNNANKYPIDHAVMIVGWDDDYSKENFNEENQPNNNGAWIIKNSWGSKKEFEFEEIRREIFNANEEYFIEEGYESEEDISEEDIDDIIDELDLEKNADGKYEMKIGDNGFMYISYDDVNIYSTLCGIENAENNKDYFKIYQHDELGFSKEIDYSIDADRVYIANVFNRDANSRECIDKISVFTLNEYKNCKVYINPNGSSRESSQLKEVKLKNADDLNIKPGYRTIEFDSPVKLNSSSFAVVLEFDNTSDKKIGIAIENNKEYGYQYAEVNSNESFVGVLGQTEMDLGEVQEEIFRGNVCLKAFAKIDNSTLIEDGGNNNTQENGSDNTQDDGNNNSEKESDKNHENEENNNSFLSSFKNLSLNIFDYKINIDTSDIENSYAIISLKIDNIIIGDESANYKYSYYLSDKNEEKDINEEYWNTIDGKLEKQNDGTYYLVIDIDSRNLKNINEITKGDNLYLYLKEIGTKGSIKQEQINIFEFSKANYSSVILDGKDIGNVDDVINDIDIKGLSTQDYTVANKILPNTGIIHVVVCAVLTLVSIGAFAYLRYINIDK